MGKRYAVTNDGITMDGIDGISLNIPKAICFSMLSSLRLITSTLKLKIMKIGFTLTARTAIQSIPKKNCGSRLGTEFTVVTINIFLRSEMKNITLSYPILALRSKLLWIMISFFKRSLYVY